MTNDQMREAFEAWHKLASWYGDEPTAWEAWKAGIAAGMERDHWQPIETAPKDGTPLLLFARCITATAPCIVVGWHADGHGWIEASFRKPVGIVPTHWMPLPPFPVSKGEKA